MIISLKHKFVFVRITKTASTTIKRMLEKYHSYESLNLRHTKIQDVGIANSDNYFKFAFTRNPWDRFVSGMKYEYNDVSKKKMIEILNGQSWIKIPQHQHVFHKNKKVLDYTGKVENLQNDFDYVCDKIGIPQQKLPHKNKTQHKHYTEYYDDETKEMVAKHFEKDIKLFNYKYGE